MTFSALSKQELMNRIEAIGLAEATLADGRKAKLPALPLAFGEHWPGLRHDLPAL